MRASPEASLLVRDRYRDSFVEDRDPVAKETKVVAPGNAGV